MEELLEGSGRCIGAKPSYREPVLRAGSYVLDPAEGLPQREEAAGNHDDRFVPCQGIQLMATSWSIPAKSSGHHACAPALVASMRIDSAMCVRCQVRLARRPQDRQ